ncbi:MAG TPA: hypothetical protein VGG05_19990 [Pseudonocardiaceae bacterium]|jgi:hypothetical protein
MATADEAWAWLAAPVEKLRAGVVERPGESWQQRREDLRTELAAATRDSVADELLTWLDELSDSDRTAIVDSDDLAGHVYQWLTRQLPPEQQPAAPPAPAAAYDETAWYAHLAQNGRQWNGTGESWGPFREWFLYYAADAGFTTPATQLLDYLQPMAAADRVTTLGQYGVTIQAPAPAEPAPEVTAQQLMADVVAENPEFAEIPEERRIELTKMLLAEMESQS